MRLMLVALMLTGLVAGAEAGGCAEICQTLQTLSVTQSDPALCVERCGYTEHQLRL